MIVVPGVSIRMCALSGLTYFVDHDGSHIISLGNVGSDTPGVVFGFGRMGCAIDVDA